MTPRILLVYTEIIFKRIRLISPGKVDSKLRHLMLLEDIVIL